MKSYAYGNMYIYPKTGAVYIHVLKSGGTAVNAWLLAAEGHDIASLSGDEIRQIAQEHHKLVKQENWEQLLASGKFVFGFVRNPWRRVVSAFCDKFVHGHNHNGNILNHHSLPVVEKVRGSADPQGISFREFLDYLADADMWNENGHWRLQSAFLSGAEVDFVGRIEKEEDRAFVQDKLGIPFPIPRTGGNSRLRNLPSARDLSGVPGSALGEYRVLRYEDFLAPDTRKKISKLYTMDLERFGYEERDAVPDRSVGRDGPAEEPADIETASDAYAQRFSGSAGSWMLRVQEKAVIGWLRDGEGGAVVDVGGGHGQLAGPMAGAGLAVTVLGSAPSCAARIRELIDRGQAVFVEGDPTALPFESRSFDAAICIRLLTHSPDWRILVHELCRVARNAVIVDYPASRSVNCLSGMLFGAKKRIEGNTRPFVVFRHAEVAEVFAEAGFEPAGRKPQFFLPMVLHRVLRCPCLSAFLEGCCRCLGLTALFGSPVLARYRRGVAG